MRAKQWLALCLTLTLLCALTPSTMAETPPDALPGEITAYLAGQRDMAGFEIVSSCQPNDDDLFVLLKHIDVHALCLFTLADGEWAYQRHSTRLLPATEEKVYMNAFDSTMLLYDESRVIQNGVQLCYVEGDNDYYAYSLILEKDAGVWKAASVSDRRDDLVIVELRDGMHFYTNDGWVENPFSAIITFHPDRSLPHYYSEMLDTSAEWLRKEYGDRLNALTPNGIDYDRRYIWTHLGLDARFDVYAGPGTQYLRPASGKARVSAGDWFAVLGKEGDWLMVLYEIDKARCRVGWIDATVNAQLRAAYDYALDCNFLLDNNEANVYAACKMYDDPIYRKNALCTLKKGQIVRWLGNFGNMDYIEAVVNGQIIRGFVAANNVGNG